ncbi:MAG: hypothetical protein ACI97A_000277 [Planctomycetota bacterium]|jgi:hypothetical protein
MTTELLVESDLEAAAVLLDSGDEPTVEPETWHGGPSFASLVLMPFGVSARKFVDASGGVRDIALDLLKSVEKRRAIRSLTLCFVVAVGFAMLLNPAWRLVACGGVAIKAGIDMGRFSARNRTLASARSLAESDLELTKPEDTQA